MFTVDSRTERFMDAMGVRWRYSNDLTADCLAKNWMGRNLGRSECLVENAVLQYGTLMDKGSPAPAPILWMDPNTNCHEVIDGVQRLAAWVRRVHGTFSAYVVETDSQSLLHKLRIFANYRLQGGHQESAEWTLAQAILWLLNSGEATIEELADIGGWLPSVIRDKKECMDCGLAIRSIGGPQQLPDSIVRVVVKNSEGIDFSKARDPLASFFNDIKVMKMSAAEAEPYIERFFCVSRKGDSLYEQFSQNLDDFRSDEDITLRLADPSRRRYQPMTGEGKLLKSFKAALTIAEMVRNDGHHIAFMQEYYQLLTRIRNVLKQIESHGRRG